MCFCYYARRVASDPRGVGRAGSRTVHSSTYAGGMWGDALFCRLFPQRPWPARPRRRFAAGGAVSSVSACIFPVLEEKNGEASCPGSGRGTACASSAAPPSGCGGGRASCRHRRRCSFTSAEERISRPSAHSLLACLDDRRGCADGVDEDGMLLLPTALQDAPAERSRSARKGAASMYASPRPFAHLQSLSVHVGNGDVEGSV